MKNLNINDQIKKIAFKNIISPFIVLVVSVALLILLPIGDTFAPHKLDSIWEYSDNDEYVHTVVDELYYSGYNVSRIFSQDYGYYYTFNDERCLFVLIPVSSTPEETLENYKLYGRVISAHSKDSFNDMISSLATDLNWNEDGLTRVTVNHIISNADYYPLLYFGVFIILLLCLALSVYNIGLCFMRYNNPATYPVCPRMDADVKQRLIAKANKELNDNILFNVGDLYLTEHYFIEFNNKKIVIIPLLRVIWSYRMGTMGHTINNNVANYNLFFILKSGDTITIQNKTSDQTQLILEKLREMNLGIILGYTDSKRKKVKELRAKWTNSRRTP